MKIGKLLTILVDMERTYGKDLEVYLSLGEKLNVEKPLPKKYAQFFHNKAQVITEIDLEKDLPNG